MGVYNIMDIVGTSEKSFADAAKNTVLKAAKTVKKYVGQKLLSLI